MYFKKGVILSLSCSLLLIGLSACGSGEKAASSTPSQTQATAPSGANDAVKQGASEMQQLTRQLQQALEQKDMQKVKQLSSQINDRWLSFENEVRDRFPLLYTEVEKFEQPLFAQGSLEQPNVDEMQQTSAGLINALEKLKNAKETTEKTSALLQQSVDNYTSYVNTQVDQLVKATKSFADAIKAGNIEQAKVRYAQARPYYERIEPIAESLGDLDPKIDARIDDVEDPSQWTGFHRLEKALWEDQSLAGQQPYADQLYQDVKTLQSKVQQLSLQPQQIVAGAMELLNEAAISKITGEEERYSHLDLLDLSANVEGSEAVYQAIIPALQQADPQLAETLDQQFLTIHETLSKYREGDRYIAYDKLTKAQIRALSDQLSRLSDLMAQTSTIF